MSEENYFKDLPHEKELLIRASANINNFHETNRRASVQQGLRQVSCSVQGWNCSSRHSARQPAPCPLGHHLLCLVRQFRQTHHSQPTGIGNGKGEGGLVFQRYNALPGLPWLSG